MRGQQPTRRDVLSGRGAIPIVPRADLVNTLEYEEQARRTLAPSTYGLIAGGSRDPFDRITLHPRQVVPVLDMDLTATLFGDAHFTPILVGPIGNQQRFHADGELATVKGASAAKTAMVASSQSSVSLETLVAEAKTPLWFQVFASDPDAASQIKNAVKAGCKVVCVTVGAKPPAAGVPAAATLAAVDWAAVSALTKSTTAPVIVKGIATPEAAKLAVQNGADGIVVSTYGGLVGTGRQPPILSLSKIVDAVGSSVPVLADGSFRRGTDIVKALAFGARAVLVGRPVMWGLAAYGAEGVQGVIEMLQTELARYMGMCGKSTLAMLDRTVVRVHAS